MDSIHDPDHRPWISALVKPAEILAKFKEEVTALKPILSVNEHNTKSQHLKKMIGVTDDETFKELELAMDIDNLTTKGELLPMQIWSSVGSNYGMAVPKFYETEVPEDGRRTLKTLYLHDKWRTELKKDRKMRIRRRRQHYEDNDNWFQSQPKVPRTIKYQVTDRENLYCVRVYRPLRHLSEVPTSHKEISYTQDIWLLGHNKLSELRDMITCAVDNNIVGKQQVDTLRKLAVRAGDAYKSGFFYINGCFYNDTRDESNIDYSKVIIDWANQANMKIGPFRKAAMEETVFDDLELRVGYPYLYTHQGNHEHLIVFHDIRLVGPDDPQVVTQYPFVRALGTQLSRYCMLCQADIATWVTENNSRVPDNPFFFCTICYKRFNFKKSGEKETDFSEYRYLDVNCV